MQPDRPRVAPAFALVALFVGVKLGGALALHWLPAIGAALVAGVTAALALAGLTAAFGGARLPAWRVTALGAVAAIVFLALRAL